MIYYAQLEPLQQAALNWRAGRLLHSHRELNKMLGRTGLAESNPMRFKNNIVQAILQSKDATREIQECVNAYTAYLEAEYVGPSRGFERAANMH